MKDLEDMEKSGAFDALPTKEAMNLRRELMKLLRNLDGLRNMNTLPGLIFVVDTLIEKNAIHEARLLGIPVVAIVDTNCDPDDIDYPIPGNDDAIKATKLITARIADAVMEGREGRSGGRSGAAQAQPAAAAMTPSANGGETKDESDKNGKAKA